ncbi:DNA/RNA helicase domain-containing protein [Micromonospora sp. NPDC047620]|uniref:DNA/RNA helicase domain-containing protein n=1 Tax=Micromonospora sp. NPDC047620 TaxID=3364251 RepID=UPI00370FF17F
MVDEVSAHLVDAGYSVEEPERESWRSSLPVLARHLCELGFSDLDALVEYQLPRSSQRIDVILAGAEPTTLRPAYLVLELKQWSEAERYDEVGCLLRARWTSKPLLHPSVQVEAYCSYLVDHLERLREWPEAVHGMAYLHNATADSIPDRPLPRTYRNMLYTPDRAERLPGYLAARFSRVRDGRAAQRLLTSPVRQSARLLATAADEVGNRGHFVLLDKQREAYELVMRAVRWADAGRRKRVVIVSGGPGTGKSAIALDLFADLLRKGRQVNHATGSKAFTRTLQLYAREQPLHPSQRSDRLFKYFMNFTTGRKNGLDVLICDESHRIRERTTRGNWRAPRPQVQELIDAAKVPVFLLDDHQIVRPDEVGSVAAIREAAERLDLEVDDVTLGAQFRCGGSPRYERWVRCLLGLENADPHRWIGDENFRLGLANSPEEMESILRHRNDQGETARISAGFCWPWTLQARNGRLAPDVRIGAWARPWNAFEEHPPPGIPSSSYWATDPGGFRQIGCIYTAQGFEYHWSGVILGPDLVVRGGRFVTRAGELRDSKLVSRDGRIKAKNPDRLIRNAYKVLLTRGLFGTLLYSVDPETQEFLSRLIPPPRRRGPVVAPGVRRVGDERVGAQQELSDFRRKN